MLQECPFLYNVLHLDFDKVIACGGSWMVNKDMVKAGDFESIKKLLIRLFYCEHSACSH